MPRTNPKTTRRTNPKKREQATSLTLEPVPPRLASTVAPHFMSVNEVARILAVSTKTIRRAIDDRRLSAVRFGRRVLVSQGALQQFMTALISGGSIPPAASEKL